MVRTPFQNCSRIGSDTGQDIRNARTSVIFMSGENTGNSEARKSKGAEYARQALDPQKPPPHQFVAELFATSTANTWGGPNIFERNTIHLPSGVKFTFG